MSSAFLSAAAVTAASTCSGSPGLCAVVARLEMLLLMQQARRAAFATGARSARIADAIQRMTMNVPFHGRRHQSRDRVAIRTAVPDPGARHVRRGLIHEENRRRCAHADREDLGG